MKKFLLFLMCVLISNAIFAISIDSAEYNSVFEKELFKRYLTDSSSVEISDFLFSFLYAKHYTHESCRNVDLQSRARISKLIVDLKSDGLDTKSTKKQVKTIYQMVHENFLVKYMEQTSFADIFHHGYYNCATATALYTLFLNSFDIPYHIMETPNHTYIVANPEEKPILMESTRPSKGVLVYDSKYKSDFVEYLRNNKIISQNEYETTSTDVLFDEYHNKDIKINQKQLVALLYYNQALDSYNKHLYTNALADFKKACVLYPGSKTIDYGLYATFLQMMQKDLKSKEFSAALFVNYINTYSDNDEALLVAEDYVGAAIQHYLLNQSNVRAMDKFFNEILESTDPEININTIKDKYFRAGAYYYETQSVYSKALAKMHQAYILNTKSVENKNSIQVLAQNYLASRNNYKIAIDSAVAFINRYPFLINHSGFLNNYYYNLYLAISGNLKSNKIKEAYKFLETFEKYMGIPDIPEAKKALVEQVYVEVSEYYVRKRQYKNAINYVDRGLRYATNSSTLEKQRRYIAERKNYASYHQKQYQAPTFESVFGN